MVLLTGNSDADSVVEHLFTGRIQAQRIKVTPLQFHLRPCLRIEIIGCAFIHGENVALTNSVTEGYIMSPNYPSNYPTEMDSNWIITAPSVIQLDFVDTFDIEYGPNCPYDYVRVIDGLLSTSPVLGTFCGTELPPIVRATGNAMTVQLHSDYSVPRTGFKAKYSIAIPCPPLTAPASGALSPVGPHYHPDVVTVTCNQGYVLDGDSDLTCQADACLHGEYLALTDSVTEGYIMSPNYPGNYPERTDCSWTITAPSVIQLEFVGTFDIEFYQGLNCDYDWVKVYDGRISPSSLLGTFCGIDLPPTVRTVGNVMTVQFHTDYSERRAGFRAKYSIGK
ncbi:tolloid-like protein 1 [Branchiostoma floridae]|uniref:Tolloid-like protein 1 n=1 Tax=Branchiostoma floridae TaxID=7739 RepID=A0A9J7KD13_BRAFL|nr:tolloid-like protein 1 [Branchiostoma floridae]